MHNHYNKNGVVFWTEEEIYARNEIVDRLYRKVRDNLIKQNPSFRFFRVEAPILTPVEEINTNYSEDDYFQTQDFSLRPETTMGSYAYARYLLTSQQKIKMPIVVWQYGKSFRREQDHVLKHMRLKEFYQLEFQIIFSSTTLNDYSQKLKEDIIDVMEVYIGDCEFKFSDRVPSYAEWTEDIECMENHMEVCSISKRNDFDMGQVLEVAIGADRMVYNHFNR